jgi:hypothetical protein
VKKLVRLICEADKATKESNKMIASQICNLIGLASSLLGTWLIWRFGLPASVDREGWVTIALEDKDQSQIEKGRKYDKRSNVGFILVATGFIFQTLGTLWPSGTEHQTPSDTPACPHWQQTSTMTLQESSSKFAQKPPRDR